MFRSFFKKLVDDDVNCNTVSLLDVWYTVVASEHAYDGDTPLNIIYCYRHDRLLSPYTFLLVAFTK